MRNPIPPALPLMLAILAAPQARAVGVLKHVALEQGQTAEVRIGSPVIAAEGAPVVVFAPFESRYDRATQTIRGTPSTNFRLDPSVDLAPLLSEAFRAEGLKLGYALPDAGAAPAGAWRVSGSLKSFELRSYQNLFSTVMIFHSRVAVSVTISREGRPDETREYRIADMIAGACGAFSCKGGASVAIAQALVKTAHGLWARLNVEYLRAAPHERQTPALEEVLARGAEGREAALHRLGLAAPEGAAARLAAILPREHDEDESDAAAVLDTLSNLDDSALTPTLCAFLKGKDDEDERFYLYKALHAAGGEEARRCLAGALHTESDDVNRELLSWYLAP